MSRPSTRTFPLRLLLPDLPDAQELAKVSADAGLPVPPDLTKYSPDVAVRLGELIHAAAAKPTAASET